MCQFLYQCCSEITLSSYQLCSLALAMYYYLVFFLHFSEDGLCGRDMKWMLGSLPFVGAGQVRLFHEMLLDAYTSPC